MRRDRIISHLGIPGRPRLRAPSDDDGDNVYHVSLSISDGTADGGQVNYAVTVTDDPPEGVLSISGDAYDGAT